MSNVKSKIRPTKQYPELVELATDIAIFTQKWTTPRIARTLDVSKQSLQKQIDKKKGKK